MEGAAECDVEVVDVWLPADEVEELLCEKPELDAPPEEWPELAPPEECCAKRFGETARTTTTAKKRLEIRMKHLLRGNTCLLGCDPSYPEIMLSSANLMVAVFNACDLRSGLTIDFQVGARSYERFSKIPAAPIPPPTHMVTMP